MVFSRLMRDFLRMFRPGDRGRGGRAREAEGLREAADLETRGERAAALGVLEDLIAQGRASAAVHARAGALNGQLGRLQRAREALETALRIEPAFTGALADLGLVWRLAGNVDEAIRCLRHALRIAPRDLHVICNLANCLLDAGDVHGAFELFASALQIAPRDEGALRGLAGLIGRTGSHEPHEPIARIVRGIADRFPDHAVAWSILGYIQLKREFDAQGALRHLDRAIALGLRDTDTLSNRGIALQDLGRLEEAMQAYDESLAIDSGNRAVRFHRSLAMLLEGRFEAAWDDYELRAVDGDIPRKMPDCPIWNGEPVPGKTLLVCAEQGLGDEIMFASCLHEAIARSGRCVIDCSPRLAAIVARSFPGVDVHAIEQRDAPRWQDFAPIDFAIRAGSLPRLFRRSAQDFPRHGGYLLADPVRVERMRERLARAAGAGHAGSVRRIGISWRGGTQRSRAPLRSLSLERLLPLLCIPGILWVSLQYDAAAEEVARFAREQGVALVHWQDAIDDYEETAALASALDLTVSVCTAIVHLCGALGRPVRVLAPHSPEWRYGARGESMIWYPSVRVLRQSVSGKWDEVLDALAQELAAGPGSVASG